LHITFRSCYKLYSHWLAALLPTVPSLLLHQRALVCCNVILLTWLNACEKHHSGYKTWIGCILYADDIILLSASLSSFQVMLNKVCATLKDLKLNINCTKSTCVVFVRITRKVYQPCHLVDSLYCGQSAWNIYESIFYPACIVFAKLIFCVNFIVLAIVFLRFPMVCLNCCSCICSSLFVYLFCSMRMGH